MDQYEIAEQRQGYGNRLRGYSNAFRYQANKGIRIFSQLAIGPQFVDTLGTFFPMVAGKGSNSGVTLNNSITAGVAKGGFLTFHNSKTSLTDMLFQGTTFTDATGTVPLLVVFPNSATSVDGGLAVVDRSGSSYTGLVFLPANAAGGSFYPNILDARAGTGTNMYLGGANNLQIIGNTGGISTNFPYIGAWGTATDIDIGVVPKGAGLLNYYVASIGGGGGAAATLTTIGGSGPTTAAQNGWVPMRLGTLKVFVPVWT